MVKDGNIQDRARILQDCVRDFQVCLSSTFPSEMTLNFSSSTTLNLAASDCDGFSFLRLSSGFSLVSSSVFSFDATDIVVQESYKMGTYEVKFQSINVSIAAVTALQLVTVGTILLSMLLSFRSRSSVAQDSPAPIAFTILCYFLFDPTNGPGRVLLISVYVVCFFC